MSAKLRTKLITTTTTTTTSHRKCAPNVNKNRNHNNSNNSINKKGKIKNKNNNNGKKHIAMKTTTTTTANNNNNNSKRNNSTKTSFRNSNKNKNSTATTVVTDDVAEVAEVAEASTTPTTLSTFSNTHAHLSLFDQLKNSANLNNIRCCSNISNNSLLSNTFGSSSIGSCNSNYNNKFQTQKNLTDWRRFVEDDSSNHSATSCSSSCSSSSSNSSFCLTINNNNNSNSNSNSNRLVVSEKDSFQQQFVASVLGGSGGSGGSGSILKATKLDAAQISTQQQQQTADPLTTKANEEANKTNSNNKTNFSKMNEENDVEITPATTKGVTKVTKAATTTNKTLPFATKKSESESCGKILDLTLQGAKHNEDVRASTNATTTKTQTTIVETKLGKVLETATRKRIDKVTTKTATNTKKAIKSATTSENKMKKEEKAKGDVSKISDSTADVVVVIDDKSDGTYINDSTSGAKVNKNVKINENNNKDKPKCETTAEKTDNEEEEEEQQQQQRQQPKHQNQVKFTMPALPLSVNVTSATATYKSAKDENKKVCNNNTNTNKDNANQTTGSVGIVRGIKRTAATAAIATTVPTVITAAATTTTTATTAATTAKVDSDTTTTTTSSSSSNNFTSPAALAPLSMRYFMQNKRQKQNTTTIATHRDKSSLFSDAKQPEQKQYMENLKALLDSGKFKSVNAQQQNSEISSSSSNNNSVGSGNGNDLKSVVYSALTNALCGGSSFTAVAASKLLAVANQAKRKRKKKRCTDRCDSSESSDSGVVISLSSTDSSTGSSEDASEPGSPFSQHSIISDEQQSNSPLKVSNNHSTESKKIMPPHNAVMTPTNGKVNNGQTANASSTKNGHSHTIIGTNSNNSNNTAKLKQIQPQQQTLQKINTATVRNGLPTLQWPWNNSTTNSNNTSTTNTGSPQNNNNNKKRGAATVVPTDNISSGKKARNTGADSVTNGVSTSATTNACGASAAKRLKAAALEESQTKITGYFKSQMKSQIHQSNITKRNMESVLLAACSSSGTGLNTTSLTMSAPATTASLNKYFNILAQLKENSNINNSSNSAINSNIQISKPTLIASSSVNSSILAAPPAAQTSIAPLSSTSITSSSSTNGAKALSVTSNTSSMPVPALKKIERSKPPKIAQVAPNLRKTPSASGNYTNGNGKSPAKKHVAIAPRTPEIKQQQMQQQQQQAAAKAEAAAAKQTAATSSNTQQSQSAPQQVGTTQPAVLLTAIRLPAQTSNTPTPTASTQIKPTVTPPKLAPVATATGTTTATAAAPGQTLYQLPPMQLPNLVQLPQLLAATNGANIMQLNNVSTAAKATNNTAAAAAAAAATSQAAQAAAAQYFLNGTVFKLQQFTTATTTTATSAVAAASAAATPNPFNLMTAAELQDILIKQQQQLQHQQQMQLQQQQKAAAVAAAAAASATAQATNASFQEIFQQQIAAAIAANQQQQQHQQYQQLQRLGAAAAQPVFMATPAGLLLNAASLPAMLAQAAAALAVNNNQHQQKQMQMQQSQPLPALQPIQSNALPALSSIFANAAQHQQQAQAAHDQQNDFQQQQQQLLAFLQQHQQQQHTQFITATQPPPLSAVNATAASTTAGVGTLTSLPVNAVTTSAPSNNVNTAKLAIVKATTSSTGPQQFTALNSQPPPLVTISHGKSRATAIAPAPASGASSNINTSTNKPAALTKPYQKRMPKVAPAPAPASIAPIPSKPTLTSAKAKITTGCKIIASPTTPPPLVPALSKNSCSGNVSSGAIATSPTNRTAPTPKQLLPSSGLPTPALISIAPMPTTNTATNSFSNVTNTIAKPSAIKLAPLPLLAPKISAPVTALTSISTSMAITTTTIASSMPTPTPPISKVNATANTTTTDLFDLVKNSNGATTISPPANNNSSNNTRCSNDCSNSSIIRTTSNNSFNKCTALLPSFCNSPMSSCVSASSPSLCGSHNAPSDSFCSKIKVEPVDDGATAAPSVSTSDSGIKLESFISSMHKQMLSADIKVELMEDTTKMYPSTSITTSSSSTSITQANEYSSYSFSSHSNSVSSAADLSLEASTPPSLSSLSASCSSAPSPLPSCVDASPSNSPPPLQASQSCESSSASLGSESSSVSSATAATGRDMLSELVTSSCISSNLTSDISNSADETHEVPSRRFSTAVDDVEKDVNMDDEESPGKRDLPTPESGIGGSLTASEGSDSSESIVSTISSSSSKAEVIANIINSIDSNSPPPTPLSSISAGSIDSASRCSSLRSTSIDNNSVNIKAPLSPFSPPISINIDNGEAVCLSEITETTTFTSKRDVSNAPSSIDNSNSNSCASISISYSSSSGEPQSTTSTNCSYSTSTPTFIDIKLTDSIKSETTPKCAISPILSQPKTIRFPAEAGGYRYGSKGAKRHDGVCYWNKCNKKHDSCSKLLDHMQTQHVNSQTGPFSCLWVGCKVYNKESCSRRWLERHVLSHGGSKQFKCIVEGCGLRFGSQLALQKHVNNHFTASENKESTNKRTSDPPVPKQLRKNGKKLRYRRQPFSARMFDFFDTGIMEGLQHRLRQISILSDGCNTITFRGECMMRRKTAQSTYESFVRWTPREIIPDEWVPACDSPYTKTVNIKRMSAAEKIKVEGLLMTAYKMPYSPNLFDDIGDEEGEDDDATDDGEEDDGNNDDEADVVTLVDTVRSSQQQSVITTTRMQAQQWRKHPRKPMKRVHTETPFNL